MHGSGSGAGEWVLETNSSRLGMTGTEAWSLLALGREIDSRTADDAAASGLDEGPATAACRLLDRDAFGTPLNTDDRQRVDWLLDKAESDAQRKIESPTAHAK